MTPITEAALILGVSGSAVSVVAAEIASPTGVLLWAAGVITALGVLWRFLHISEITKGLRHLIRSFNGEPERPGFPRIPGIPERLAKIEGPTHETKGAMPSIVVALEELQRWATENGDKIDVVDKRVLSLDQRVTDHRRRNELQAEVLRQALENRASDIERRLSARDAEVDKKLGSLSDDLLRAQTWRAALHELGIGIESRERPRDDDDDADGER